MPINTITAPALSGRMVLETTTAALAATASRKRTKSCLLSLIGALGLAVFSNPAHAQQPGIDIGTHGRFQIWRTTTLGSYKGVDSYRDALDAAKMKIGDAADEILVMVSRTCPADPL